MSNLESGLIVYSEEHDEEGRIESMSFENGSVVYYDIEWPAPRGIKSHLPHEADNFFRAHALRRFPQKEEVV